MNDLDTDKVPGDTSCLGWCNESFYSPDKKRIRICPKCRSKYNSASAALSRADLMSMGSSPDRSLQEICKD